MPRAVQRLDHPLELEHLIAQAPGGGVLGVRRQVADRAVAPVVAQAAIVQEGLVGDVMDRQQLDGGDAQALHVGQRLLRGQSRVGAAQVLAHGRMALGVALDVGLVDDRLVPRAPRRDVALPVERAVDDHRLGNREGVVLVVGLEVRVRRVVGRVGQHVGRIPVDAAFDRLGVGIDEQLDRVEAVALLGRVAAVHAVAVALAGADARQVAVPVVSRALDHVDALLGPVLGEQAQLDVLGVL